MHSSPLFLLRRFAWIVLGALIACFSPFLLATDTPPQTTSVEWWHKPAAEMVNQPRTIIEPPKPHFDPRNFGAKGDGQTYDTVALQKAIDACGGTGGSVILSSGKFVSAQLTLRPKMTFYVQKGATLLGGSKAEDYPVLMPQGHHDCYRRSLLYADHADGLTIDGEGEIDGRGSEIPMYGKETERPSLIRIFNSKDVVVRNVTLLNPRMWTQTYTECTGLLLDHLTVRAPFFEVYQPATGYSNFDGMDICDCRDVVIRSCDLESEDDTICLKSQRESGLQNVLIENNWITSLRANGIKLGTATIGPVSDIRILNNTVRGAKYGGLCLESVDGSAVRDIRVSGLDMYHVNQPIFVRLGKRTATRPAGSIDGISIEKVRALATETRTKASCSITGISSAHVGKVHLKDCYIEMPGGINTVPPSPKENDVSYPQSNLFGNTPAYGMYVQHADPVLLENVAFGHTEPDARPWLNSKDANVITQDCRDLGQIAPLPLPASL